MSPLHVHGITVEAATAVAPGRPRTSGPADLTVVAGAPRRVGREVPAGELLAVVEGPAGLEHAVARHGGGYLLRIGGAAEIEVDADLRRATTHCDPGFDPAILEVLVAGYLLATVLQLRGHLVLHASGVEVDGRAYALVGPSGRGKSTLATLLCDAGALLVTDDVLRVDPAEPLVDLTGDVPAQGARHLARLGATSTRLRSKAAALAGEGATGTADGRTAAVLALSTTDRLPLAGVLLPWPDREATSVRIDTVSGTAALFELLSAPRILGWRDPVVLARQLAQLGDLASSVPVHRVRVPWGPPFADDLGAQVLTALTALGATRLVAH